MLLQSCIRLSCVLLASRSQPMTILRRDFDITTFGAVLLFLCRAPFRSVRGEFSRCSDFSEAGRLVDGMYNLDVMPDIAISVYCKGTKDFGLPRSALFQFARVAPVASVPDPLSPDPW